MLSQGTSFTFNGGSYAVTSVRVQAAQPEIVDMTPFNHPINTAPLLKATGAYASPASVDIELIGNQSALGMAGAEGDLSVSGPVGGFSGKAICESVNVSAQVGDVVRGSARFTITAP